MTTSFGIVMKRFHIKYGISCRQFAEYLNVSAAYLSAIECGKRNIPQFMEKSVSEYFGLTDSEREELRRAIEKTNDKLYVDMTRLNEKQKRIVWYIMDYDLTREQTDEILKILEKK